jgi:signal transduction histidine kinase
MRIITCSHAEHRRTIPGPWVKAGKVPISASLPQLTHSVCEFEFFIEDHILKVARAIQQDSRILSPRSGLGLAIAAGIVKAHKGKIWVESPGYDEEKLPGSTFIIQIPLAK